MLQNIRDNVQGVFAKVIIGLIIIPFAAFGIDSLLGGGGVVDVAEVNGEKITNFELQQGMAMYKRQLLNRMGENADPALLEDALIRDQVLDRLVQEKILLQRASEESIGLGVRQVDQAIVGMQQFQENGQFSVELYQNILRGNGYTPAFFKQLMLREMTIQQASAAVSNPQFVTEVELAALAAIVGEKRSYRYMLLPLEINEQLQVSDDQVSDYYQQHLAEYQREEQVLLDYIEIKKQDFYQAVDEQLLIEAFAEEMEDFKGSEQRRASHIYIEISDARTEQQARAQAQELLLLLQGGASFAELAAERSDDPGSSTAGGDLGFSQGDTFPDEFEQALFALELNAVSEPVQTDDGFHLIKLTEIKAVEQPVFAERKELIRQRIQSATANTEFITVLDELRDYVFNADDLNDPASDLKLTVQSTAWLSKSDNAAVFANTLVRNAAFSEEVLIARNNSEVIEITADHFIVVSVKDYRAAEPFPLAEVEAEIKILLARELSMAALQQTAQELIVQLDAGESIESLAQANNYQWQLEIDKLRNSIDVNPVLLEQAFSTSAINVYGSVYLEDGSLAIWRLEKTSAGTIATLSEREQRALAQEINRIYASRDMALYLMSIRQSAEVELY